MLTDVEPVVNVALNSFIAQGRLDQVIAQMKKGDYVLCEFGHNDQKERIGIRN